MPLVLAAIDLKLSPSYDETRQRQKRLESLSKIIRHSETLYDVTDFVAVGTDQILQLAYTITQNIFHPYVFPPRVHARKDHSVEIQGRHQCSPRRRAKNWLDAFISCPRAYLLISTSVDYSLAVGRLPCDDSLPQLVRDFPSKGYIVRLPWTIDPHPGNERICISAQRNKTNYPAALSRALESITASETSQGDRKYRQYPHLSTTMESQCKGIPQSKETFSNYQLQNNQELCLEDVQFCYKSKSHINLDFLELGSDFAPSALSAPRNRQELEGMESAPMGFTNSGGTCFRKLDTFEPQDELARPDGVHGFDTVLFQSYLQVPNEEG